MPKVSGGVLFTVGAEVDEERINSLLYQVKGKDITELIASGREKLASVPSGGGAVAISAPTSGGGAAPAAAEQKKEEVVEEKQESDDVSFLSMSFLGLLFRLTVTLLFVDEHVLYKSWA